MEGILDNLDGHIVMVFMMTLVSHSITLTEEHYSGRNRD
jgi:hypothetical protein